MSELPDPRPTSIRAMLDGEEPAPLSADYVLGLLVGSLPNARIEWLATRGEGTLAVVGYAGAGYRVQIDPVKDRGGGTRRDTGRGIRGG